MVSAWRFLTSDLPVAALSKISSMPLTDPHPSFSFPKYRFVKVVVLS
jgi:hypothetical protein